MKRLRNDPVPIPSDSSGGAGGTAFDIKYFPDSIQGVNGPFKAPSKPKAEPLPGPAHSAGYFQAWVDYFVNVVGSSLELLNGYQFDLDKGPGATAKKMSKELANLSAELSGKNSDRQTLVWPLVGLYTFAWDTKDATAIGYATFTIEVNFENEPDYRMVVNCSVGVRATDGPVQPISSSSSYLGTSSSG
jgi:hypothetical protein